MGLRIFVAQIDDHRDRLFCARVEQFLAERPGDDRLVPFAGRTLAGKGWREETEVLLRGSDLILALYSPEAAASGRVGVELHLASKLGKPGGLLVFPGMALPAWAGPAVPRIALAGFKDSGPGLPPGTDEWEILRSSTFVRESLPALGRLIDGIRAGRVGPLPPIPEPTELPRRFPWG